MSTTAYVAGSSARAANEFVVAGPCLIVAESDPKPGAALRVVASAANEAEAALLQQRLAQAGIQATSERAIGGPEMGASGARYIYVAATDLERAREVLGPSDQPEPGK